MPVKKNNVVLKKKKNQGKGSQGKDYAKNLLHGEKEQACQVGPAKPACGTCRFPWESTLYFILHLCDSLAPPMQM